MSFNLLQFCPISLYKLRFRTNWKGNGVNSKKRKKNLIPIPVLNLVIFHSLCEKKEKKLSVSLYSRKWHGAVNLSLFSSPPPQFVRSFVRSLLTLERISIDGHLKALGKQITFSTLELSKKTAMGFLSDFFPLMVPIFLLSKKKRKNYFSLSKNLKFVEFF